MIVFDLDIPNLTKEGIDIKRSIWDIQEFHCSSIIDEC